MSMNSQEFSRIALAAVFGFAAIVATGQPAGPVWHEELFSAPPSRASAPSATTDREPIQADKTAPANVLEDVPRDMGSKQIPAVCSSISDDQAPATCRRWSQIAHTL
jgi:hypothetical protein